MDAQRKITVAGVISEGIGLGIKNAISMLGATILWLLTIWIPYLNVGTTIAMTGLLPSRPTIIKLFTLPAFRHFLFI